MTESAPVVALVIGEESQARVREALRSEGSLVFCDRAAELRDVVAARGARAVLTQLADSSGADTRPVIRQLNARLPEISVIVVDDHPARDPDVLLELGRLGVTASIHLHTRNFASVLRQALSRAEEQSAAAAILRRIRPLVPSILQRFFVHCAYAAARPLLAEEAARASGISPRTLRAHLRQAGLPPPQRIVRWCRVLHACWMLDLSGKPVKAVTEALGYETDVALRKQIVRLTGLTVGGAMSRGGFQYLLGRLEAELSGDSPPAHHNE